MRKIFLKKIFIINLFIVFSQTLVVCKDLDEKEFTIFQDSLEKFLDTIVSKDDQSDFRGYYSQFLEKISKKRKKAKQSILRRLRFNALQELKKEHPKWYREVEPFILDIEESTNQARQARLFLTRFALLQKYHEAQKGQIGWWDRAKVHIKDFGYKVVSLKDKALGRSKVKATA